MSARPEKILALQFKYFGDAVLMTPALRALREHFPSAEIHVLVPEEIAPLFQHLPWLNRVWPMPRKRGRASLRETWPLIRALRREQFDRSVDFASNDRGAFLSLFIGAKQRLGWDERAGFFGRRFFYTDRVAPEKNPLHESARLAQLLSGWQIPMRASLEAEIRSDPRLAFEAKKILPHAGAVICHVASSQPKKEWGLNNWGIFCMRAAREGYQLVFTTPRGEREASLMEELKNFIHLIRLTRNLPVPLILPEIPDLPLFLAVLDRAAVFISGDTGPLHFAAGLGVPTISLFGPTAPARWAPVGKKHTVLIGGECSCDGNLSACARTTPESNCMSKIPMDQVFAALKNAMDSR